MTFPDTAVDGALKSDTPRRGRVPRERREQLLREFAASGISAKRFAQFAGVNPVTFYSWVHKERTLGHSTSVRKDENPVSFVEAVLNDPPVCQTGAEAALVVHLCGGARAEVVHKHGVPLLAQLLLELSRSKSGGLTHA